MAQGAKRVLVVDDARVMRMLLRMWLERLDVTVTEATTAVEAIALLGRDTFDLVISDVNMPGPSGFAVLDAVKRDPRTKDMPFVFLTTLGRSADIEKGKTLGATAYLTKPLSWGPLVKVLEDTIGVS